MNEPSVEGTKSRGIVQVHPASGPSFVDALVDPVSVFRTPQEIVEHPGFTNSEKRTILLSWARDELALEQVVSEAMPGSNARSRVNAVINALSQFDPLAAEEYRAALCTIRGQPKGCRRHRKERAH